VNLFYLRVTSLRSGQWYVPGLEGGRAVRQKRL
jgi:hypothetical protein